MAGAGIVPTSSDAASEAASREASEQSRPKAFRILDVRSRGEGILRLRLYFCVIGWGLVMAAYFAGVEMVLLNTEDSDTRDMLTDYKLTAPGIADHHKYFAWAADGRSSFETAPGSVAARYYPPPVPLRQSVTISGNYVPLRLLTESAPDLEKFTDSLIFTGPSPCPGTAYDRSYLSATTRLLLPRYDPATAAATPAAIPVSVLGFQQLVPAFSVQHDFDAGTVSIGRLTGVKVVVSMVPLRGSEKAWGVYSLAGQYGVPWKGRPEESGSAWLQAYESITINMDDLSAPVPPAIPAFTGAWHIWAGGGCGGVAGALILSFPILYYLIRVHVLDNNGMPPPYYHHRLKFRGW